MKYDMHVHTDFSADSEAGMMDYLDRAWKCNVDGICFTDHVDFNANDYGLGYYNADAYFLQFEKLKDQSRCQILAGIEMSEPHLYYRELEKLKVYPYDFIIGSIHWIGDLFPCREVRDTYSLQSFFAMYWDEVQKAVETGGFDCLGHIDFPKRYYGEVYFEKEKMKRIFDAMQKNHIVLEINTSSLRKGCPACMPGAELLSLYREYGGSYVTIGSDAHFVEDLAADFSEAECLMKEAGLMQVYFKQRKMIVL